MALWELLVNRAEVSTQRGKLRFAQGDENVQCTYGRQLAASIPRPCTCIPTPLQLIPSAYLATCHVASEHYAVTLERQFIECYVHHLGLSRS